MRSIPTIVLAAGLLVPAALEAQSLADRVARAPDGVVRFTFTAREGVCGDGHNITTSSRSSRDGEVEWERDCEGGPVRVAITHRGARIDRLRTHVGGRWRETGATDLGHVGAREAAAYLAEVARRNEPASDDAIFPITLADSVEAWRLLSPIAKDRSLASKTRKSAVFWLGQSAGEAATRDLEPLAVSSESREVRDAAVFALSQRPRDEGVPALIRLARTSDDPAVRKKALFWLGQSDDPRAVALFEELLTSR